MQYLNPFTASVGFCVIALTGLVGCTQPNNVRQNTQSPDAPVVQNNGAPVAQTNQAMSADKMAERVEDVLENHETLRPFDLDADDEGNAIVIKGTVRDESQRTLAEDIAKQTAPGFTIINRINVQ